MDVCKGEYLETLDDVAGGSTYLFILDLLFDGFDGVRGFYVEGDGFARQTFDKYLHLICVRRYK